MKVIKKLNIVFVLFYSINVFSSNIIDGGEIRFRGLVTDDAPKWTWRVASTDQIWDVDVSEAHKQGSKLVFNLKSRGTIPFLEGYLNEVVDRGGANLTPYITYSTAERTLLSNDSGDTTRQRFKASVPVYGSEMKESIGMLRFTLEQGMAVTLGKQDEEFVGGSGMFLVNGETISNAQPENLSQILLNRLSELLLLNKGFQSEMSVIGNGKVMDQGVLSNCRIKNIAAAFASTLSDFELELPSEGTPAQWHAQLNVTVVVH